MDFYGLTRKELQALCKKNKIPANMTNVAMADALKALEQVEGLSENPEPAILSPDLTSTIRRTSTRRKPVADTETTENICVSDISDTPVTRNGRRRAATSSVQRKIETHMKEDNEEGEEGRRKEKSVVPVHSVRRSSRLSEKRISESNQKKGSKRPEAVKIAVLSEEDLEDLEKEKSIENSEISVLEEYKVSEHIVSGEVFNNKTETFGAEESFVVDSSDINPLESPLPEEICKPTVEEADESVSDDVVSLTEPVAAEESSVVDSSDINPLESPLPEEICKPTIEEADESVSDDVISLTEPVAAEVQKRGSLATNEKEKELNALCEPGTVEDQDSAASVPESLLPGKTCNSAIKESIANTSSPRGSNHSPNKESVVGDLIGNGLQAMDSCKVDEDSEDDDEDTTVGVQNQENKESDEEGGVTSDCGSTLSAEDEIYEIELLETKCLNLCPIETLEMVGKKECNCGPTLVGEVIVEVLSEAEEISSMPPEKTSEIQSLEARCLDLGPAESPLTVGSKECAGQLTLELENVTNQLAKFVLQSETDDLVSDQQQKMNEELENVADPVPTEVLAIENHSENESSYIDESKECLGEGAENGTEMNAGIGSEGVANPERADVAELGVTEDITYSSSVKVEEEEKSQSGFVSSFSSEYHEEKSSQEVDFNVAAHVITADVTATAVIYEDILMPNDCNNNNKSGHGDSISSTLDLGDKISLPSPAINPIPTPKKSVKKSQTPGKSGNKKHTPIGLMAFEDNKENNYEISTKKLDLGIASPDTARMEMEKKKDVAILPKGFENISNRQLKKMIKEQVKQFDNKRTALQTLNKN